MRPIVKRSLDLTQRVVGALLMGLGAPVTQLGVGTWGYLHGQAVLCPPAIVVPGWST